MFYFHWIIVPSKNKEKKIHIFHYLYPLLLCIFSFHLLTTYSPFFYQYKFSKSSFLYLPYILDFLHVSCFGTQNHLQTNYTHTLFHIPVLCSLYVLCRPFSGEGAGQSLSMHSTSFFHAVVLSFLYFFVGLLSVCVLCV